MTTSVLINAAERAEVLAQLERMSKNGEIKNSLCQRLISRSAYWYNHPHGPAKAPKHAERVINGSIDFGANSLWVAGAIRAMIDKVKAILHSKVKTGTKQLLTSFESCLNGKVQNFKGDFYIDYPINNGYMHFGSQAVHAGEFIREFFELAKCHLITIR